MEGRVRIMKIQETRGDKSAPVKTPARLHLAISASTGKPFLAILKKSLPKAHALLHCPLQELSIALVGDARMSRLHNQFMQIPSPTDVLTFELDHDAKGRVTAGEIVICIPQARRECKKRGIPVQYEVLLYALHGMLHLCGFDDRTDRAFAAMHRKEDQILTTLGIGPVFSRSGFLGPHVKTNRPSGYGAK
jgi:probable rRNA maturation factor